MKIAERFYKWCHFEAKKFAVVFVCFPLIVTALETLLQVGSLFLPAVGLIALLSVFFLWGDRFWWDDVKGLF